MDEIGARLREARLRRRIDINEVELRTKIRAKYLRAMENEEWDLLPGEVYVRSFLRSYADFLGLDSRELLDDFRRRYENPSDHEPPPIAPPSRERRERERPGRPRRGIPPWVIVAVVLIVVAVVLYIVGTDNPSSKDHPVTPRTTAGRVVGHRARHPLASASSTTSTTSRAAPPKPRSVTVSLTATGTVYVCMVNGDGRILIPGQTFTAGETIPTEKAGKLLLTLGNAAVTVKANGATVPVAASSGAIGFQFTPTGHTALSGSAMPTCTTP